MDHSGESHHQPPHLLASEAAQILRTSPIIVADLCRSGELPATKPGRAWLIKPADLDAYLAKHSNQPAAESA